MDIRIENKLADLLKIVKAVLDRHKIPFWLDAGTLLGARRDGKFIPWEKDIDLGSWNSEIPEKTKSAVMSDFVSRGCSVGRFENHMNIRKNGVWADLKFYDLRDNRAVEPKYVPSGTFGKILSVITVVLQAPCHLSANKGGVKVFFRKIGMFFSKLLPNSMRLYLVKIFLALYKNMGARDVTESVPSEYFCQFTLTDFYNVRVKIPKNCEDYLAFRYGKDWMIPRQDWITDRDDGSVNKKNNS